MIRRQGWWITEFIPATGSAIIIRATGVMDIPVRRFHFHLDFGAAIAEIFTVDFTALVFLALDFTQVFVADFITDFPLVGSEGRTEVSVRLLAVAATLRAPLKICDGLEF